MWIFTNRGYLSIVENRDNPDELLVRARYKGDIEAHFGKGYEILESSDADYRFRAFIDRNTVSAKIHRLVDNIDYSNFKDSCHLHLTGGQQEVGIKNRSLFRVWDTMQCAQDGIAKLQQ